MVIMMKNKGIGLLALLLFMGALFAGGIFTANTVFAAEDKISIGGKTAGTQLNSLADMEILKVYKNDRYGDVGCTVVLPDGYLPSGSVDGMYVSQRSPLDSSNIYYTVSDNLDTAALDEMLDSEEYKRRMEEELKEEYGTEASVDNFSHTELEIDGCPAHKLEVSCQAGEARMEQLIYIIVADKTYTITYSQSADDEKMEEFKKSAGTIHVVFS